MQHLIVPIFFMSHTCSDQFPIDLHVSYHYRGHEIGLGRKKCPNKDKTELSLLPV